MRGEGGLLWKPLKPDKKIANGNLGTLTQLTGTKSGPAILIHPLPNSTLLGEVVKMLCY